MPDFLEDCRLRAKRPDAKNAKGAKVAKVRGKKRLIRGLGQVGDEAQQALVNRSPMTRPVAFLSSRAWQLQVSPRKTSS